MSRREQKQKQISLLEQHIQILYDNFGCIMHAVENLISKINPLKIEKKLYNSYDNFGNADTKGIDQIKNEILTQMDFFVSAYQAFSSIHKNAKFLWPSNIEDVRKDLELWKSYIPEEYKRFIIAVEELIITKNYTKFEDAQEISDKDPSVQLKTPQMWMSIGMKVIENVDSKLKRFEETNSKAVFKRGEKIEVNQDFLQARKKFLVDKLLKEVIDNGEKYLNSINDIYIEQYFLSSINNFKYSYENYLLEFQEYTVPFEYYNQFLKMCKRAKDILNEEDFKKSYKEVYNLLFGLN